MDGAGVGDEADQVPAEDGPDEADAAVDPYRRGWWEALADRAVLVGATVRASPGLSLVALGVTVLSGSLPPVFNVLSGVAAGAVESALRSGERSLGGVAPALIAITAVYLVMHILGPVRDGLGSALMRRVDTALTVDVMQAMSRPRGVAHLEDAAVLDRIAQAQGVVNAMTPGAGASYLIQVWTQRLQGSISLLIVAGFSPALAAGLLAGHVVAYRWRRWHARETMSVVTGRTEEMRRSQYIRRLAVEPEAAKEARVFSLAGWFRGRYRDEFLAVMEDVWRRRRQGGMVALAVSLGMFALEAGALVLVARAAVRGDIGFGAAVAYAHVVVATSNVGQFNEAHLFVTEGAVAVRQLRDLQQTATRAAVAVAAPTADTGTTATQAGDPGAAPTSAIAADLTRTSTTPTRPTGGGGGAGSVVGLPRTNIRFEQVHFAYPGNSEEIYAGLDLEIEAGRSLAIVGQNGAGKTTLMKLVARLHDPTGGRITVDGIDLRELDPAAWQRRVAAIFQDFVPYRLSAADNVAFGALHADPTPETLDRAADLAGAHRVIEGLPHGWDTVLSRMFEGGTDLSGGEWQRLALARAVYAVQAGAAVLILDEPTAALDVRGEADVYDRFIELTAGLTTIVVSHRFSTVRRADRIVVIEHGRVVEDGTHESLVAAGGRYALMYDLQAARFRDDDQADTNPGHPRPGDDRHDGGHGHDGRHDDDQVGDDRADEDRDGGVDVDGLDGDAGSVAHA